MEGIRSISLEQEALSLAVEKKYNSLLTPEEIIKLTPQELHFRLQKMYTELEKVHFNSNATIDITQCNINLIPQMDFFKKGTTTPEGLKKLEEETKKLEEKEKKLTSDMAAIKDKYELNNFKQKLLSKKEALSNIYNKARDSFWKDISPMLQGLLHEQEHFNKYNISAQKVMKFEKEIALINTTLSEGLGIGFDKLSKQSKFNDNTKYTDNIKIQCGWLMNDVIQRGKKSIKGIFKQLQKKYGVTDDDFKLFAVSKITEFQDAITKEKANIDSYQQLILDNKDKKREISGEEKKRLKDTLGNFMNIENQPDDNDISMINDIFDRRIDGYHEASIPRFNFFVNPNPLNAEQSKLSETMAALRPLTIVPGRAEAINHDDRIQSIALGKVCAKKDLESELQKLDLLIIEYEASIARDRNAILNLRRGLFTRYEKKSKKLLLSIQEYEQALENFKKQKETINKEIKILEIQKDKIPIECMEFINTLLHQGSILVVKKHVAENIKNTDGLLKFLLNLAQKKETDRLSVELKKTKQELVESNLYLNFKHHSDKLKDSLPPYALEYGYTKERLQKIQKLFGIFQNVHSIRTIAPEYTDEVVDKLVNEVVGNKEPLKDSFKKYMRPLVKDVFAGNIGACSFCRALILIIENPARYKEKALDYHKKRLNDIFTYPAIMKAQGIEFTQEEQDYIKDLQTKIMGRLSEVEKTLFGMKDKDYKKATQLKKSMIGDAKDLEDFSILIEKKIMARTFALFKEQKQSLPAPEAEAAVAKLAQDTQDSYKHIAGFLMSEQEKFFQTCYDNSSDNFKAPINRTEPYIQMTKDGKVTISGIQEDNENPSILALLGYYKNTGIYAPVAEKAKTKPFFAMQSPLKVSKEDHLAEVKEMDDMIYYDVRATDALRKFLEKKALLGKNKEVCTAKDRFLANNLVSDYTKQDYPKLGSQGRNANEPSVLMLPLLQEVFNKGKNESFIEAPIADCNVSYPIIDQIKQLCHLGLLGDKIQLVKKADKDIVQVHNANVATDSLINYGICVNVAKDGEKEELVEIFNANSYGVMVGILKCALGVNLMKAGETLIPMSNVQKALKDNAGLLLSEQDPREKYKTRMLYEKQYQFVANGLQNLKYSLEMGVIDFFKLFRKYAIESQKNKSQYPVAMTDKQLQGLEILINSLERAYSVEDKKKLVEDDASVYSIPEERKGNNLLQVKEFEPIIQSKVNQDKLKKKPEKVSGNLSQIKPNIDELVLMNNLSQISGFSRQLNYLEEESKNDTEQREYDDRNEVKRIPEYVVYGKEYGAMNTSSPDGWQQDWKSDLKENKNNLLGQRAYDDRNEVKGMIPEYVVYDKEYRAMNTNSPDVWRFSGEENKNNLLEQRAYYDRNEVKGMMLKYDGLQQDRKSSDKEYRAMNTNSPDVWRFSGEENKNALSINDLYEKDPHKRKKSFDDLSQGNLNEKWSLDLLTNVNNRKSDLKENNGLNNSINSGDSGSLCLVPSEKEKACYMYTRKYTNDPGTVVLDSNLDSNDSYLLNFSSPSEPNSPAIDNEKVKVETLNAVHLKKRYYVSEILKKDPLEQGAPRKGVNPKAMSDIGKNSAIKSSKVQGIPTKKEPPVRE